jgi:hypothetical protein
MWVKELCANYSENIYSEKMQSKMLSAASDIAIIL